MRLALPRATPLQRIVLAAMAVALVGAQALGLQHRIDHYEPTGWTHSLARPAAAVDARETYAVSFGHADGSPEHSCAAVDAGATGSALPVAAVGMAPAPVEDSAIAEPSAQSIAIAVRAPFRARAPPAFTS